MVLNGGVSGYGTDQQHYFFRHRLLQHIHPETVIWNVNVNDVGDVISRPIYTIQNGSLKKVPAWRNGIYLDGMFACKTPEWLRKKSLLVNFISNKLEKVRLVHVPRPDAEWALKKMKLEAEDMRWLSRTYGFQLIIAISPSQEVVENGPDAPETVRLIKRIKTALGDQSVIDQNEYFTIASKTDPIRGQDVLGVRTDRLFLDESFMSPRGTWHPSEAGNRIMAESVLADIISGDDMKPK
jgi:hypothetical protein